MKRDVLFGVLPVLTLAAALLVGYVLKGSAARPAAPTQLAATVNTAALATLPSLAATSVQSGNGGAIAAEIRANSVALPAGAVVLAPRTLAREDQQNLSRLRELRLSDPAAAVILAREGERLFPASPAAAERQWLLIRALTDLEDFDAARAAAKAMLSAYADTPFGRDVERHVLAQPASSAERRE